MADGYLIVDINKHREARELEHQFFSVDLDWVEFGEGEAAEHIVDQLPKDLKDVRVFVLFKYDCHGSFDSYNGDYDFEENYTVLSHTVMIEDHKEFERRELTKEFEAAEVIGSNLLYVEVSGGTYLDRVEQAIAEWEEFHDVDFIPVILDETPTYEETHLLGNLLGRDTLK